PQRLALHGGVAPSLHRPARASGSVSTSTQRSATMAAIFLDEAQVGDLLDMESCIDALDEAFREKGLGEAAIQPRRRLPFQGRRFHLMAATMPRIGYL